MRVILRLAEQRKVDSDEVVDSPFDPVIFDGEMDVDDLRLAHREGRTITVNRNTYEVRDIRINSVIGETVAEVEVVQRL